MTTKQARSSHGLTSRDLAVTRRAARAGAMVPERSPGANLGVSGQGKVSGANQQKQTPSRQSSSAPLSAVWDAMSEAELQQHVEDGLTTRGWAVNMVKLRQKVAPIVLVTRRGDTRRCGPDAARLYALCMPVRPGGQARQSVYPRSQWDRQHAQFCASTSGRRSVLGEGRAARAGSVLSARSGIVLAVDWFQRSKRLRSVPGLSEDLERAPVGLHSIRCSCPDRHGARSSLPSAALRQLGASGAGAASSEPAARNVSGSYQGQVGGL